MRKRNAICSLLLPCLLGALLVQSTGCKRLFGGSEDDAPPIMTAPPAATMNAPAQTAQSGPLQPGTYEVNKAMDSDNEVLVTRVTIAADSTTLSFKFTNKGQKASNISVAKPGAKEAMFLEQPDGRKISLRSSKDIAVIPAADTVQAGESKEFSLTFGPLDPNVRKFNMYEGEGAKTQMPGETTYWVIHDIEIK